MSEIPLKLDEPIRFINQEEAPLFAGDVVQLFSQRGYTDGYRVRHITNSEIYLKVIDQPWDHNGRYRYNDIEKNAIWRVTLRREEHLEQEPSTQEDYIEL